MLEQPFFSENGVGLLLECRQLELWYNYKFIEEEKQKEALEDINMTE